MSRVCLLVGLILSLHFSLTVQAQDTTRLSLLFIGDVMQHDTQIASAYQPASGRYDYTECFAEVAPIFESVDLAIANLELTLGGPPYKGYPNFSAPDEIAYTLQSSGIDVLVTANNHCLDRGKKGLQRTISVLDTLGIPHTGTFVDSAQRAHTYPLLIERRGFRISLLNYTYGTNGIVVSKPNVVNYIDTVLMAQDIERAKLQNPDVIITFLHWGDEYQRIQNRAQKRVAEFCFQHGVKLVIGAHPHVIQPMEWRKDSDQLVVYSLGNFVSAQSSRFRNGGAMLEVELEKIKQDSLSTTKIREAGYILQYVYRDAEAKYHILPLPEFEGDSTVVREARARASLAQFAADSRELLKQYNIGIQERPLDERVIYSVLIDRLDSTSTLAPVISDSLINIAPSLKFFGVRVHSNGGVPVLSVGEFFDRDVASDALKMIQSQLPSARAYIARNRRR